MSPLFSFLAETSDFLSPITQYFGADKPTGIEIFVAMAESFLLNLLIAFLYQRTYRGTRYSQDYVHTLIIIGTVTTALILVVAGNAAIAFGMFAAFSLIRFRRNLSQARDLAFVFFAMATGMVVGARQYEMAVMVVLVVAIAIYFLSKQDAFSPKRASHTLMLRVTNDINYETDFNDIFETYAETVETLSIELVQAGMMTEIRYGLVLKKDTSLADFMEKLQTANGNNRIVLTSRERDLVR